MQVAKGRDRADLRVVERGPGGLQLGLSRLTRESDRYKGAREATRHQSSRIIEVEIRPARGDRGLSTIVPADLVDWTQGIIQRGAPVTANHSFEILRLIWNCGRKRLVRDGIPPFPLAGFGRPWDGERPPKRHLSPKLIKAVRGTSSSKTP